MFLSEIHLIPKQLIRIELLFVVLPQVICWLEEQYIPRLVVFEEMPSIL